MQYDATWGRADSVHGKYLGTSRAEVLKAISKAEENTFQSNAEAAKGATSLALMIASAMDIEEAG